MHVYPPTLKSRRIFFQNYGQSPQTSLFTKLVSFLISLVTQNTYKQLASILLQKPHTSLCSSRQVYFVRAHANFLY